MKTHHQNLHRLDLSQENALLSITDKPSLLTSHSENWQDIYLEFHRLPPLEVPECTCQQHLITIPLIDGLKVERKADGKKENLIFHSGDFCLSPQGISLSTRWNQPLEAIQLSLEPKLITQAAYELIEPDYVQLSYHFQATDPVIYHLGIALKQALENEEQDSKFYAESMANFLVVHLLKNYTTLSFKPKENTGGLSRSHLKQSIDYIDAHLREEISLEEIANYIGLSRYYFCRLFKKSIGITPYQYIIRCRVEQAKKLLKKRNLSLSEVALTCGFSHQSHLHRHFKRLTGVTPKQFINLSQ